MPGITFNGLDANGKIDTEEIKRQNDFQKSVTINLIKENYNRFIKGEKIEENEVYKNEE